MGHISIVLQSTGNGKLVAHMQFIIAQENQVHGVVKPRMFDCRLEPR